MSGLTKKVVRADRMLSAVLGVQENELVSYAQLSKGLHKYIKDNDLKNPQLKQIIPASRGSIQSVQPVASQPVQQAPVAVIGAGKCRDCAADIPADAVFCDQCGVMQ
jgi:hypothetical protein